MFLFQIFYRAENVYKDMMKKNIRYDILFIIFLFLLSIPLEYYEFFSLTEIQTITFRHAIRKKYCDKDITTFPHDKISIVVFDKTFFEEYKSYPLKRKDIGAIINNIKQLGAKVICVDIFMKYTSSFNEDPELAKVLKKNKPILASQVAFDRQNKFVKLNYPAPLLKDTTSSGYVNIVSSSNIITSLNRLRIYPEVTKYKDGWPIAIKTLAEYFGHQPELHDNKLTIVELSIELNQFKDIYIDYSTIPDDCQFLHECYGITALDFLDISDLDEDEIEELSYWIRDKIVIIGDTFEVSHDWFDTPVGMVYGAEIIAYTIGTMLKGAPLQPASQSLEIMISFLFYLFIVIGSFVIHDPRLRTIGFILYLTFYIFLCCFFYVNLSIIISMSYSLIFGILSFISIALYSYNQERKLKKEAEAFQVKLINSYSRFVPHEYLRFLGKESIIDINLGDHISKEMAVLFSDIRSFTSLSEGMTPQENFNFVNAYLKRVSSVIRQNDGFIVKYLGDGMMAVFPYKTEDAVRSAIDKLKKVLEYNKNRVEEGRNTIKIGIGVHTGHMMVGMVGETARMQGDAFSDNVNLTARLEGLTKYYGVSFIISEEVLNHIDKDKYKVRFLDKVQVKGRKNAISIYEIFDADPDHILHMKLKSLSLFKNAQELFYEKNFTKSELLFRKVLDIYPDDLTAKMFIKRIKQCLLEDLPDDWQGINEMAQK